MRSAWWFDGLRSASRSLRQLRRKPGGRRSLHPTQRRLARFEPLEDRWLLSTVAGQPNDGKISVEYDPVTGAFVVQPDGNSVGLFDIQSAAGIFTGSAMFPPGTVVSVNSAAQKSWLGGMGSAFTANFSLGVIAAPGLSRDFLLNDLTLVGSGGFGTPNVDLDLVYVPVDFGDAPDAADGTGPRNYNTRGVDNGPRHSIAAGLRMGVNVDGDSGALNNAAATADDADGPNDDEDGIAAPLSDLAITIGTQPTVGVRVTNLTGSPAALYGWIDYNGNGVFENGTERTSLAVADGTNNAHVTLVFPVVPPGFTGTTFARFRLGTDAAAANPTGSAGNGEVEDHRVQITRPGIGLADAAKNKKIASGTPGAPVIANGDMFGSAVAPLGDLDGDGVNDFVVGAPSQTGSGSGGAVQVLLMNANGTVKLSQRIASGVGGGPILASGDYFGHSVALLGDVDGDGLPDIAVGADKDDTGGYNRGAVHVLFLNANGTARASQKIATGTGGGPPIANLDRFGSSTTALGDLDGDGVTELAVGASGDDTNGAYRGAVHILFLNKNGTVKATQKIASGVGGGPTLANGDEFGIGVASLGDLDGDGLAELAVGAFRDDTGGNGRGAVHVLYLNANGSVKSSTKIASGVANGPVLADSDYFGRSVAAIGDLDGDGVTDLAVGAYRDSTGGTSRGAVHVLLLNANGTVKNATKIANVTGGGPALLNDNRFGSGVAALGDLDGDGVVDLAVGAETDNTGGTGRGAVHLLFLRPGNTKPTITSPAFGSVPENSTAVMTLSAFDPDSPPQTVAFSLIGGPDQGRFMIVGGNLLSFVAAPDFEAPADANADNLYVVTVQADDGSGGTATQTVNVTVTPVNDNTPVFTSPDQVNVAENTTAVTTLTATDADLPPQAISFSIAGGADQSKFMLTGGNMLSFKTPPDFEFPTDANGDNTYIVIVQASDGSQSSLQAMLVTVTNQSEPLVGDYNGNGVVDAADYVVWRNGGPLQNEGDTPGAVTSEDYHVWRANFGRALGTGSGATIVRAPPLESRQTAAPMRTTVPRPAQRVAFPAGATRDVALVAWLASRQSTASVEPLVAERASSPIDRAVVSIDTTKVALDVAFAALIE